MKNYFGRKGTPSILTPAEIAAAEQAGRDAYHQGIRCAPCLDPVMCGTQPGALMAGDREIGEGTPLLEAWTKGWTDENLKAPIPGWTTAENAARPQ